MKFAKRITALLVVAIMLASSCVVANAATSVSTKSTYQIVPGVSYTNFNITSGQNGNTVAGTAMEFNPKDGYIPMTFVAYAGNVNVLKTQYDVASSAKYGYDVAGAVNGSFFTLSKGCLDYANISNGILTCAHVDEYNREYVAFDKNGGMKIVWSKLEFKLFVEGTELPNAIYCINKPYNDYKDKSPNGVYYYDTSCGTIADSTEAGYEIVCQKMDNTNLKVGKTLTGKVLQVKSNSYGTEFETNANVQSDKFVLFVKAASPFAASLKNLKAGANISIQVNETVASGKATMENAMSIIPNVGSLIINGVDQTRIKDEIGGHSVTYQHRQTAFGQKADGTYVFVTTDGNASGANGSLTMRDVADYLLSKGCVNAVRMDGGGSTGMYVKNKAGTGSAGYVMNSERAIADAILIIKKPTPKVEIPENLISYGKKYTTTAPNRTDDVFDDDGVRLTNGLKSYESARATTGVYSAWGTSNMDVDITVDLGSVKTSDTYKLYSASLKSWGITCPSSVTIQASTDGKTWTSVGKSSNGVMQGDDGGTGSDKTFYYAFTVKSSSVISARYIKFTVDGGQHTWVDEVEVYGADAPVEPDPEPEPEPEPDPDSTNIAYKKNYTTSDLYSNNGSIPYPDEGGTMTDGEGAPSNAKYDNPAFIGFNAGTEDYKANGYASITVDLGASYSMDKFVAKVATSFNSAAGLVVPGSVSVYVSNDNKTWTKAGEVAPTENANVSTVDATITLSKAVTGRYVQYRFQTQTDRNWIMVSEVEAYGVPAAEGKVGDVNNDGKVDSLDYLFVKRYCLGTYDLSGDAFDSADINKNEKVDSLDYLLVKRIVLGTYSA